jgi:hypothetical protein
MTIPINILATYIKNEFALLEIDTRNPKLTSYQIKATQWRALKKYRKSVKKLALFSKELL